MSGSEGTSRLRKMAEGIIIFEVLSLDLVADLVSLKDIVYSKIYCKNFTNHGRKDPETIIDYCSLPFRNVNYAVVSLWYCQNIMKFSK